MAFKPKFAMRRARRGRERDLVGLDIVEDHLKIAHVRVTATKRQVVRLASKDTQGQSDEDLAAFIRKTVEDWQIPNAAGFLAVPLSTIITRSIEIPSRDPEEIREIVSLQASRHTPYARTEIVIDTLNLGLVKESYTRVLLVIAPREVISRHTHILELAGLPLKKVFFPSEAIVLACQEILGRENSSETTAIVHMDSAFTSFIVAQKQNVLFVRGIAIGASSLLEERDVYRDRFVDELQKSLESYNADEAGAAPTVLLLTGVVAEVTDLDYLFTETLHIPIKHQTYFNYFSISEDAKKVAAAAKNISFFNIVAPLLLYDRIRVDFVTEERRLKMEIEERGRQMVNTGILVLSILCLVFALFASKVYFKSAYLSSLSARYQPIRQESGELEAIFGKTQVIKDYLRKRGNALEMLALIYDTLPRDIRLTNIRYDGGERFAVKGTSDTMASVFTFITNLEKTGKLDNVKTKYVNSRSEEGRDVADFEIVSIIARSGKQAT